MTLLYVSVRLTAALPTEAAFKVETCEWLKNLISCEAEQLNSADL